MSQRQPDRRRQTSGGSPRRGAAARAASTTRELLANIARVIMLAIMVGATLRAVAILVDVLMRPAALGSWPTVNSYAAFSLATVSIVLMLAMALNSSYLPDRLFAARHLGALFVVVWATGAVAIVAGLVGAVQLGAYVAIELLPAVVAFVLMGLVSPGLYRRPGAERPASRRPAGGDEGSAPRPASPERSRQRRGGRAKR
ncbi:MAG: hypothetical protein ABR941_05870 [Thermoleophilia bacterium]|jgi:hypothetical protein